MIQTWICVLVCQALERATCALVGHPIYRVRPGVAWCTRCGRPVNENK